MDDVYKSLAKSMQSLRMTNPALELAMSMQSLQMTNPALELAMSMQSLRMTNPALELVKSMQSLRMTNPALELVKSMQSLRMTNPALELVKSMQSLQMTNPVLELAMSMQSLRMTNPALELAKSMQSLRMTNIFHNISESFKLMHMTNPMHSMKESILALQKTQPFINNLKKTYKNNTNILTSCKNLDNSVDKILKYSVSVDQLNNEEVMIHTDGTISLSTYTTTQDEITSIVNNIISKAFEKHNKKMNEITEAILTDVNSLKDTKIRKIINIVIIPIIINMIFMFIMPFTNIYIESFISKNKKYFKKLFSSQLITNMDDAKNLKYLRIITTDNLEVKSKPSRKFKCIANLKFGEIVLVINKNRDWSFIQKNNEDGDIIMQGWVFSRYLKIIK